MVPSICGLIPRPELRIALSTALTSALSQTLTSTIRGSGTVIVPSWLIGIVLP